MGQKAYDVLVGFCEQALATKRLAPHPASPS
jgi:hypothetical protein